MQIFFHFLKINLYFKRIFKHTQPQNLKNVQIIFQISKNNLYIFQKKLKTIKKIALHTYFSCRFKKKYVFLEYNLKKELI